MYKNNAVRWFLKSYYLLFDLYEIMRPGKSSERGGGGEWGYVLPHRQFPIIAQLFIAESLAYIYIYINNCLSQRERERERERERDWFVWYIYRSQFSSFYSLYLILPRNWLFWSGMFVTKKGPRNNVNCKSNQFDFRHM